MARAPLKGGGGGKRAPLRLIDYWPLVPCLTVLLWGYTDYRWAPAALPQQRPVPRA